MHLHWPTVLTLLALILLANGLPALLGLLLGPARAVDGGWLMADGQPLFGPSKTWRGLAASALGTMLAGLAVGLGWLLGLAVAVGAMAGDLIASFVKRRLGRPAGYSVPLLDQIPEVVIPCLLAEAAGLGLDWSELAVVVPAFVLLDLGLTPLRHWLADRLRRLRRA